MNPLVDDLAAALNDPRHITVFIPDNGRDGDQIGRPGSIIIYDPRVGVE